MATGPLYEGYFNIRSNLECGKKPPHVLIYVVIATEACLLHYLTGDIIDWQYFADDGFLAIFLT